MKFNIDLSDEIVALRPHFRDPALQKNFDAQKQNVCEFENYLNTNLENFKDFDSQSKMNLNKQIQHFDNLKHQLNNTLRSHLIVMEQESQVLEWAFEDDLYKERVRQMHINFYNQQYGSFD